MAYTEYDSTALSEALDGTREIKIPTYKNIVTESGNLEPLQGIDLLEFSNAILAQSFSGVTLLTGSGTLDFPSVSAGTVQELTITVTGAAQFDPVVVSGVPTGELVVTAYVESANTVTVRVSNVSSSFGYDMTGRIFKVVVFKF